MSYSGLSYGGFGFGQSVPDNVNLEDASSMTDRSGHPIRLGEPILAKMALGSKATWVGPKFTLKAHGLTLPGARQAGPIKTALDVPTWAAGVKKDGDGIVMTTAPGADGHLAAYYIATRNIVLASALNQADPGSVVLIEPSAGWVKGEEPNYLVWGAGAAVVLFGAAVILKQRKP